MCASRAASPSATIFLVNAARKQNSLTAPELVKPQAHLKQLIQSNSTNVQALVLQGMLYQNQGKNSLAASLFKQAIAQPHKNTDPDENLPKRLARFIGFELENSDPNLDPRRPEDLELDVVQAHMQLSILQFTEHDDEAALENLKVAALKYDEPVAYFLLAERADQYSLEWLEYTRKAAASGYSSSMEDMGVIHSWSEEDLKQNVKDERVRDWILNNPLFGTEGWITSLTAALSKSQQKNLRTVKRYEWAVDWHVAADQRAHDRHKWAPYRVARLQWAMADLKQHIGQAPIWQLRYERVVCLKNMHYLEITKGVDPALKSEVEVVLRDILKDAMGREARALNIHWHNQGRTFQNDGNWLKDFLKSIDNVPIGKWR
jgi:hypothetical protein